MTDRFVALLFQFTSGLLVPILVVLALMLAGALWTLGGLAREALDRRRSRPAWRRFLAGLQAGDTEVAAFSDLPLRGDPARLQRVLRHVEPSRASRRKALDDLEIDMARRLAGLSFATRVGPMLGLVGTLLPLGPALRGLASEHLASLAENLEIAFTSTVFGLLIGGLAYGAGVLRRNWYDQDLSDLEFVLDGLERAGDANDADAHVADPVEEPADA